MYSEYFETGSKKVRGRARKSLELIEAMNRAAKAAQPITGRGIGYKLFTAGHSERHPLSGASRFRGSGHDVDIYALGRDAAPLVAECKARKSGGGFVQLEKWLGEFDLLFLRRNNADPLVVLPWRVWAQLIKQVRR
jgi:hypothetical protein